jgi:hypothetical protein
MITATDLLVLFQSFARSSSKGGVVRSVTIYPSDFGLEQMAKVWGSLCVCCVCVCVWMWEV